ncbi:hypothetical protein F9L07_28465 [Pimelobacter simplex]|uniref:Uncharacterized protein n=1 Tax=Nocardioides simplex TaxID=2045 RepID=A0A7J5DQK6_NOCSI|nr:hypothetical protein [Pimelobacter simplex]KAB2806969.1 hypothetical protein F9L07_28465 [Pimelobacter simplex]
MTADQLRNLAAALDQLAELRRTAGVVPGEYYDGFPKVHVFGVDESWELEWVDGDNGDGHYTAAVVKNR